MSTENKSKKIMVGPLQVGANFFTEFWDESWIYTKTIIDILREPGVILDAHSTVLVANDAFYTLFQIKPKDTVGKSFYALGNGQWDIPALRNLLEDSLPKDTFLKGFEVEHNFPIIGKRTMILNARHIHSRDNTTSELFPPIIMITIEDVSEIMSIAGRLADYTNLLEKSLTSRTQKLEVKIATLEKLFAPLLKNNRYDKNC